MKKRIETQNRQPTVHFQSSAAQGDLEEVTTCITISTAKCHCQIFDCDLKAQNNTV